MKTTIEKTIKGFENAEVSEDSENFYVDLKTGLGESIYPQDSFTLDEAINEAVNWKME